MTNNSKAIAYLPNGTGKHIRFQPGINEVSQEDLDAVIKQAGKKWANHYCKYLSVITPTNAGNHEEVEIDLSGYSRKELESLLETEQVKIGGENQDTVDKIQEEMDSRLKAEETDLNAGDPARKEQTVAAIKVLIADMTDKEIEEFSDQEEQRVGGPRKTVQKLLKKEIETRTDPNE